MDINLNNDTKNNEEVKGHHVNLEEKKQETDTINSNEKNQKGENKYIPCTMITMLLILIFSFISVASYAPIKSQFIPPVDDARSYMESWNFVSTLSRLTNYLYQSKFQEDRGFDARYENVESVKYYLTGEEDSIYISNMPSEEGSDIQRQIEDSLFYLHVVFDEEGNPAVENSLGERFDKGTFLRGFVFDNEDALDYADLEILYIVPQDFEEYDDLFTYDMKEYQVFPDHIVLILIIGGISILLLMAIAFAIPYPLQNSAAIVTAFNKLFLEFKMLLWLTFILINPIVFRVIGGYNMNDYNHQGFNIVRTIYDVDSYFYLIGIPITFVLFMLVYLTTVYVKYIYYTGFKEGFIKNSIIGKVGFGVIGQIKVVLKKAVSIDIKKDPQKKIFTILAINLFIVWLIALGGGLMFLLAIAYSIYLFKYFLQMMDHMKDLHDASSQLAEGDFNISLKEDIGMLSPIAKDLNNIKEGFQSTVDKEIQSQRMKTELISNVSHDLKTPLTSIINYVDLLKEEDLREETRQEYLDILDKKSKRLNILIEDLFEASKANSGNVELYLEEIDVIALFRQTLGELEEKIKESSLKIKTSLPDKKVICQLDGKRTYRVFENIMGNIFKYAMENSRVYIDVVEDSQEVSFIFKNISSYEMNFDAKEITERFARGDRSRSTEGSGLGLSIAKSFVEMQNGDLAIHIDGDLFKLIIRFPVKSKDA